ncbi:pyridoxal-5'-phosphate-dependent protein beta subunit [Capsaspora owczarzaki ATCC 30864]|uniref:L-serine ammonia-lyase n=1 Tax=Capsaspora owczarzaki (strain ATCC 30864) TaxID=595528 RepID=A0A0D2WWL3_CAPO3|nr:pyridoxal-5'-phosphate-dependent protein beta subunit [Capsaspora owczarzaki ATCC 30864]KJE96933.1 pyridoxal-5'-phosphate-dependent protein beta subunit [Capsaspora owczarzaki ATCC 30864]|eukprot:XP_004343902.2 pyridoxal-5'-phosphate-dependent protein beta subunit [Capsaspora owczarzaki ATCC 30864]
MQTSAALPLHIETACIHSIPLSRLLPAEVQGQQRPVYLKLENTQPSNSFKLRAIGNLCAKAVARGGCVRFVSSSGGNAGYAAAVAARMLGLPVHVVLPTSTPGFMRELIESEGAIVTVYGSAWDEAHAHALELAAEPGSVYIPPFDHPDLWEGTSTLVDELFRQLPEKPAVIAVAVGGGGLLAGVVEGLHRVGNAAWKDVPVIAVETAGADSLAKSVEAGELVTLPAITSIAKSLGAKRVAERAFQLAREHPVICQVVPDASATRAVVQFAEHHHMVVEPACGAALAALYDSLLASDSVQKAISNVSGISASAPIVVVVCGGNVVTLDMLASWRTAACSPPS